jgi:protein CWC15
VYRKPGQGGDADHQVRDLRAELLQAEAAHFAKVRGGPVPAEPEPATNTTKRQLENGEDEKEEDPEAKRRRILEETRDIDADSDDADEDDSSEDDRCVRWNVTRELNADQGPVTTMKTRRQSYSVNWKKSSVREPRKESKKSEQAFKHRHTFHIANRSLQERERAAAEEAEREHDIALGNPLLNPKADFNVKRRYGPHTLSVTSLLY